MSRYWIIRHYDSIELISEYRIPFDLITENQMENLIRALTAKHALTDEEIINSYLKKNTRRYADHLEVCRAGNPFTLSCGSNPYFVVHVEEEE